MLAHRKKASLVISQSLTQTICHPSVAFDMSECFCVSLAGDVTTEFGIESADKEVGQFCDHY